VLFYFLSFFGFLDCKGFSRLLKLLYLELGVACVQVPSCKKLFLNLIIKCKVVN
jgi:hypothetical protein